MVREREMKWEVHEIEKLLGHNFCWPLDEAFHKEAKQKAIGGHHICPLRSWTNLGTHMCSFIFSIEQQAFFYFKLARALELWSFWLLNYFLLLQHIKSLIKWGGCKWSRTSMVLVCHTFWWVCLSPLKESTKKVCTPSVGLVYKPASPAYQGSNQDPADMKV